jgi:hypothetical protein
MAKKTRSRRKTTARRRRMAAPRPRRRADGPLARTEDVTGTGGVFAIMLDDLIRVHPRHFPITQQSTNLETLQAVSQHNGAFVLIPRATASAVLLENKDLINAMTGTIDEGAIYRITAQ